MKCVCPQRQSDGSWKEPHTEWRKVGERDGYEKWSCTPDGEYIEIPKDILHSQKKQLLLNDIERLRGMKLSRKEPEHRKKTDDIASYNQALSDLISLKQQELKDIKS